MLALPVPELPVPERLLPVVALELNPLVLLVFPPLFVLPPLLPHADIDATTEQTDSATAHPAKRCGTERGKDVFEANESDMDPPTKANKIEVRARHAPRAGRHAKDAPSDSSGPPLAPVLRGPLWDQAPFRFVACRAPESSEKTPARAEKVPVGNEDGIFHGESAGPAVVAGVQRATTDNERRSRGSRSPARARPDPLRAAAHGRLRDARREGGELDQLAFVEERLRCGRRFSSRGLSPWRTGRPRRPRLVRRVGRRFLDDRRYRFVLLSRHRTYLSSRSGGASDQSEPFELHNHLVNGGRGHPEEGLRVCFGRGAPVDCGVGVDEGEVLALQGVNPAVIEPPAGLRDTRASLGSEARGGVHESPGEGPAEGARLGTIQCRTKPRTVLRERGHALEEP